MPLETVEVLYRTEDGDVIPEMQRLLKELMETFRMLLRTIHAGQRDEVTCFTVILFVEFELTRIALLCPRSGLPYWPEYRPSSSIFTTS
jgi:hypothetical protein